MGQHGQRVPDWPIEEIADSVAATVTQLETVVRVVRVLVASGEQTNARLLAIEEQTKQTNRVLEGARL